MSGRNPSSPARRLAAVFCVAATLGPIGCTTPPQPPPATAAPQARLTPAQYPPTFDAGIQTLRDAGFTVDRSDYRFGRITTEPKGSPTVFEPWKGDNQNVADALRSTLGDLRRTVTLFFEPVSIRVRAPGSPAADAQGMVNVPDTTGRDETFAAPPAYTLRVEVLVERMQVPRRRMNGATQGSVFADLSETPQELRARGISNAYWQPIGRDTDLEHHLLDRIINRASKNG